MFRNLISSIPMNRTSRLVLGLSSALALAVPAVAVAQRTPLQAVPLVQPGARVRVSVPQLNSFREVGNSGEWQIGTVQSIDTAAVTLRMERDGSEFRIPMSVLRAIEVSRGTVSPGEGWTHDARSGGLAGMAAGATVFGVTLLTHKAYDAAHCDPNCTLSKGLLRPTAGHAAILIGGGGVLGALVGGVLGATSRRERWESLPVPPVRMQVSATGATVSIRI
jgi:hypothetical protein